MFRTILTVLIFTMLVSACAPSNPTPLATPSSPDLGETWTLTMHQSGGIVGLSRSIVISSDGKYTVSDEREGKNVEGQLSVDELSALRELLAVSLRNPDSGGTNSGCADCFIYTIEFKGDGSSFAAEADDTTLAASGLEPLVILLRSVMDESLK